MPEGLNQVSDGGTDSAAVKGWSVCSTVLVCPDAVGKACEDEGFLVCLEGVQEWVILDSAFLEEHLEFPKSASVLGAGLGCNSSSGVIDSSVDTIHEEIAGGRGLILKFCGIWAEGAEDRMRLVSEASLRWKSLDRESAIMLCFPGMCSGYSVAWFKNKILAKCRAILSCSLLLIGLNVEWYNQPTTLLLSVNASMCGDLEL